MSNDFYYRNSAKLVACAMLLLSMPAYSGWIDSHEALRFGAFVNVSPTIQSQSSTFSYTYANPQVYGDDGTLEQVLQDQDRQDADNRLHLQGHDGARIQLHATQVLTKDYSVAADALLYFSQQGSNNLGANWGVSFNADRIGSLKLGSNWAGLDVTKTQASDLLSNQGTNIHVEYTGVPNLTVSAFHMLAPPKDTRDRKNIQLLKASGAAVSYEHNMAPRQVLRAALGAVRSTGHVKPFYVDVQQDTANAVMGSISYQHQNLNTALDIGQVTKQYNGIYFDKVNTKVLGVKVGYDITPQLTAVLDYSREQSSNNKPIDFKRFVELGREVDEELFFEKVVKDNYGLGLTYELYRGLSITGSVANDRTRNFLSEGEFSRRSLMRYNAGINFSF